MHPVLFHLPGGRPVFSYGAMLALSIVLGYLVSTTLAGRDRFPEERLGWLYAVTIASALVGSRVLFVATNLRHYHSLGAMLRFSDGGLVAYGGFLGGFFGSWAFCRAYGLSILAWGDAAVPSMALGLCLTRIGCFLYGCDYGTPWRGPLSVVFPLGSPAWNRHRMDGLLPEGAASSLPVHPTQLYESVVGLLLLALTLWVWRRRTYRGEVMISFSLGYGVLRFLLELLRGDDQRGGVLGLSTSQIIAVGTSLAAGALWLRSRRAA